MLAHSLGVKAGRKVVQVPKLLVFKPGLLIYLINQNTILPTSILFIIDRIMLVRGVVEESPKSPLLRGIHKSCPCLSYMYVYTQTHAALRLTNLGLVEVLGFAFAGLDPLFLHSQGPWYLSRHQEKGITLGQAAEALKADDENILNKVRSRFRGVRICPQDHFHHKFLKMHFQKLLFITIMMDFLPSWQSMI